MSDDDNFIFAYENLQHNLMEIKLVIVRNENSWINMNKFEVLEYPSIVYLV